MLGFFMAGVAGLEPAARLLESRRLPINEHPHNLLDCKRNFKFQNLNFKQRYFLDSLCIVCFLHHLQNFFNSNFFSIVFLFFRV